MVHAVHVPLEAIPISGLDLGNARSMVAFASRLPGGLLHARRLIRRFAPDVVVGAAGYVSVPVVAAARMAKIPVVLLEQNALPGRATRLFAGGAHVVAASFAGTAKSLPKARVVHTGNPIRAEVEAIPRRPLGERCRQVLVMGGSQGARRLNEAVLAGLRELLESDSEIAVTHQTGALDEARVTRFRLALPVELQARYHVAAFFSDIASEEAAADLIVMRAGGSSLAEASALGRPMVLVPYPHAGGHQQYNAAPYVDMNAAVSVDDAEFSGNRFVAEVRRMIVDRARWHAMARASSAMGRPDAAARVVELVGEAATWRQFKDRVHS